MDYPKRPSVLRDVALEVSEGEIVGLVGQSGAGKSTFAMAALRLLTPSEAAVQGSIVLAGRELTILNEREMRAIRGRMVSLIPQNPLTSLNPALKIGRQMREAWCVHAGDWKELGLPRVLNLFQSAGLDPAAAYLDRWPRQISAGQAQRVLIAMALLHEPALIIADEPTSALDLLTQREILRLLSSMNTGRRTAILFISHDIPAMAGLCHRVAILHEGTIVECGTPAQVLRRPAHPYTRALVDAVPEWCPHS